MSGRPPRRAANPSASGRALASRRALRSVPAAALALALAGMTGATAGCARAARPSVRPAANADDVNAPPIHFFPSVFALAAPEDAIVRVVGPKMSCSGTLVDDDLVLTAHHCVVDRGAHGEYRHDSVAPGALRVELGGDYLAWGDVGVSHVVAPPCGESGGAGDVAILVLERKLVGLGTLTPRLDAPPRLGEVLDPAGFGRCALSADGIHRSVRVGGSVRAVTASTFDLQASVCPGDSGGPVIARGSHEVVGVVSLSAMDADERTRGTSIMSRIDSFRSVFATARLIADGTHQAELPPLSCER